MKNIFILATVLLFVSCDKDKSIEQVQVIDSINFTHTVDRNSLILGADTCCTEGSLLPYTNANGQKYNVQRLMYLISDIKLHTESNTYNVKDVHYIDFEDRSTHIINLNGLNLDTLNYNAISFTMGLNNETNLSNVTPGFGGNETFKNRIWHTTMVWPNVNEQPGGYHYMKLEGDYDTDSTGYATHTGPTMGMDHSFYKEFEFNLNNSRQSNISITINMNINNWYTNPHGFSIASSIMMDMPSQMELMNNGSEDVFSISLD